MRVLLSRRDTVKLLILSELIKNPECSQREIAKKLMITPQAVSEHFKELIAEGYVEVLHKGYYVISEKGKEWLNRNAMDLHLFTQELIKSLYSSSVMALAVEKISVESKVYYWFENGFVYAKNSEEGNGIALMNADEGEEILIKPIEPPEPPKSGEILVFKVPVIERGGSRNTDIDLLKRIIKEKRRHIVVAVGLEALVACRKSGIEPIFFGGKGVCVEAAHHGSGVIAVVTESMFEDLLRTLIEEKLQFDVVDGTEQKS